MTPEKLLTLQQLQDELAKILPNGPDGEPRRPSARTLYDWMEAKQYPLPYIAKPGTGKGTGRRTGRWFRLSDIKDWLENPAEFYARRAASKRAS